MLHRRRAILCGILCEHQVEYLQGVACGVDVRRNVGEPDRYGPYRHAVHIAIRLVRRYQKDSHGASFQHGVTPQPTPWPPRRPVVTPICCRPQSHCAWVTNGPWVAAVSVPPGCCETTMNHQNRTVNPRLTPRLLLIVSS